jgi:hypothetical protein
MKKTEQAKTRNPYQPHCFHDLFYIQPQPRDRRAPSLVVVHALIVVRRARQGAS